MMIRTALAVCAAAFAILAGGTAAYAADPYGGFGPSEPATQDSGADQGAVAADVYQALPWLQPQSQSQSQPENYGGEWYEQRAVQDDGSDVDVESGH